MVCRCLEKEPESVELDVRAVLVPVGFFASVSIVSRDRETIGTPDVTFVFAGWPAQDELEHALGFIVVSGRGERFHRKHRIAKPSDVPLSRRERSDDATVGSSGLANECHA